MKVRPVKIKSKRGRPPLYPGIESAHHVRTRNAKESSFREGRQNNLQRSLTDALVQSGFLSFDQGQAIQKFHQLYRSYSSILQGPRYARARWGMLSRPCRTEEEEDAILSLWKQSVGVLSSFGVQGESLLKKLLYEKPFCLNNSDLEAIREISTRLVSLYGSLMGAK